MLRLHADGMTRVQALRDAGTATPAKPHVIYIIYDCVFTTE